MKTYRILTGVPISKKYNDSYTGYEVHWVEANSAQDAVDSLRNILSESERVVEVYVECFDWKW